MKPKFLCHSMLALVLVATGSCGGRELELLDDPLDEEAERERVRRLMNARVFDQDLPEPAYVEMDADTVLIQLTIQCRTGLTSCSGYPTGNACDDAVCVVETNICLAHTLLEIAGLRDQAFPVHTTVNWDIPAQSTATNVAFLKQALASADYALRDANEELRNAGGLSSTGSCILTSASGGLGLNQTEGSRTRARVFAASFVEAYHLHAEASQAAVDAELAVADSAFSSSPGLGTAVGRAIGGNDLSRSAAAHMLVGGDEGLEGAVFAGFCATPDHTPQVRAAIEVLREAAVSPEDILSSMLTTESLLAGNLGAGPSSGSVRQRLGELWGRADLAGESDATEVAGMFNLRVEDFVAARVYLSQELSAFARARTKALEPRELAGGGAPTYQRYAGTASAPEAPPDAFYAALARYTGTPDNSINYSGTYVHRPIPGAYQGLHRAFFVDAAISNASDLVTNGVFGSLADDALDPLGLLISDGARTRTARIRFCRYPQSESGTYNLDIQVNGYSATDGVRVVIGEDGLRCAVDGNIEGAPCDLAAHTHGVLDQVENPSPGFNAAAFRFSMGMGADIADKTRLYVVVPESPSSAGFPGGYQVLAGLYYRGSLTDYCTLVPVVPEAERRAADALRPSANNCTYSSVTCAGERFDARLPLEDELSSDGDDLETSWRHYLALARAAADEADLRAEEVIAAGLENDQRSESAVEELLDICGAGIDPTDLIDPTLADVRPGVACSDDAGCAATGSEYRCRGGQCVLDAVALVEASNETPARNRLRECLGDDSTREFVTLGTQPVCIWRQSNDLNRVCQGQNPMAPKQCPVAAVGESQDPEVACAHLVPPTGHNRVLVTTTLGYFDTETHTPVATAVPPCAALRRLRQSPGLRPPLDDVRGNNFFRPYNLQEIARRISWEPRFGGFSAITVDRTPRFATGTTWQGAQTSAWPCASAGLAECAAGDGLFCSEANCADDDSRALFNDRMFRAVVAARLIGNTTSEPLAGVRLPIMASVLRANPPAATRERAGDLAVLTYSPLGTDLALFPFDTGIAFYNSPVEAWRAPTAQGASTTLAHGGGGAGEFLVGFARIVAGERTLERPIYFSGDFRRLQASSSMVGLWNHSYTSRDNGWFYRVLSGHLDPPVAPPSAPISFGPRDDIAGSWWYESLVPPFSPTTMNLLDGAELLCQVGLEADAIGCNILDPPPVASSDDLPEARRYLECVAADIGRRGALSVFTGMPVRALDALRQESLTGAFPATGGLYSVQVSQLRAGLIDVAEAAPLLASEIRLLAFDMEELRTALALGNIRQEMGDIQFMSTVANQIAACGSSSTAWGAAATCANSLAQIAFTSVLHDLEGEAGELERELAVIEFRRRFESRATNFQSLALRLTEASESIDASLAEIERLRSRARRALAKALFLDSEAGSGQYAVNSAMRARLNTRRTRYANAHRNAVRMAFIAKRAVEQRLGISLSQITDDLPLVAAPATWEASVCASTGVDYSAISSGEVSNFADAYIGDYVDNLERVVESYRLVHAFHEGTDTAVVSLRDDVLNVRAMCPMEVPNLLYQSGCLDCFASDELPGWSVLNCATDSEGVPMDDCVHPYPLDEAGPFPLDHPDVSAVRPFEVVFGRRDGVFCSASCGLRSDSELSQVVDVPAGRYRLSWYGRTAGGTLLPQDAVKIEPEGGSGTIAQSVTAQVATSGGWSRYWRYFDLPEPLPRVRLCESPSGLIPWGPTALPPSFTWQPSCWRTSPGLHEGRSPRFLEHWFLVSMRALALPSRASSLPARTRPDRCFAKLGGAESASSFAHRDTLLHVTGPLHRRRATGRRRSMSTSATSRLAICLDRVGSRGAISTTASIHSPSTLSVLEPAIALTRPCRLPVLAAVSSRIH